MSAPVFKLANGDVSAYAMACGYIQTIEQNNVKVELYGESCCYHVRSFRYHYTESGRLTGCDRLEWDSFDTLTEARKRYRELVRKTG